MWHALQRVSFSDDAAISQHAVRSGRAHIEESVGHSATHSHLGGGDEEVGVRGATARGDSARTATLYEK